MANEIAKRDQNSVTVLMGITDDANQELRMLRVDPVTGRLKVSGAGGSGSGFQQPLSGVCNGVNKTFTWATAPNALAVDEGKTIQKVQYGDGVTTNWTGTTTTVLTIAPNFDIFAVA